jgi:hypothetical protein
MEYRDLTTAFMLKMERFSITPVQILLFHVMKVWTANGNQVLLTQRMNGYDTPIQIAHLAMHGLHLEHYLGTK